MKGLVMEQSVYSGGDTKFYRCFLYHSLFIDRVTSTKHEIMYLVASSRQSYQTQGCSRCSSRCQQGVSMDMAEALPAVPITPLCHYPCPGSTWPTPSPKGYLPDDLTQLCTPTFQHFPLAFGVLSLLSVRLWMLTRLSRLT